MPRPRPRRTSQPSSTNVCRSLRTLRSVTSLPIISAISPLLSCFLWFKAARMFRCRSFRSSLRMPEAVVIGAKKVRVVSKSELCHLGGRRLAFRQSSTIRRVPRYQLSVNEKTVYAAQRRVVAHRACHWGRNFSLPLPGVPVRSANSQLKIDHSKTVLYISIFRHVNERNQ